MTKRRTERTVRLISHAAASLVRTRTTRKSSKRKAGRRKRLTPAFLPTKLKYVRERLGLSQSEIAEALGVENRASISGYERGEREPPLPTLLKYARLSGLPVDYFIDDQVTVRVMVTK